MRKPIVTMDKTNDLGRDEGALSGGFGPRHRETAPVEEKPVVVEETVTEEPKEDGQ